MSDRGWFRTYRSAFDPDHPVLSGDPASRREAWLDLVGLAAHEPTRRRMGHEIISLVRGECIASIRFLAGRWRWDKSKVERFLALLIGERMIETGRETPRGTVYVIVNYEIYQADEGSERDTPLGAGRDEERTGRGQRARHKADSLRTPVSDVTAGGSEGDDEETNGASETPSEPKRRSLRIEEKNMADTFLLAWSLYPKRAGGNPRNKALHAWNARLRAGVQPEAMIAGVERYAAYVRAEGIEGTPFVKQAATFFGPDAHWTEDWGLSVPRLKLNGGSPAVDAELAAILEEEPV